MHTHRNGVVPLPAADSAPAADLAALVALVERLVEPLDLSLRRGRLQVRLQVLILADDTPAGVSPSAPDSAPALQEADVEILQALAGGPLPGKKIAARLHVGYNGTLRRRLARLRRELRLLGHHEQGYFLEDAGRTLLARRQDR
jgi:hypothetical protein